MNQYKYFKILVRFRRFVYKHETGVVRFLSTCMLAGTLCLLLIIMECVLQ